MASIFCVSALLGHVGLRGVFWTAAIPGMLSILAVTLWAKETGASRPKGVSAERRASLRPPLSGRLYYLLAAVGIFSLGNSSDMFLVLRAQDVGIAAKYALLLGLVFNISRANLTMVPTAQGQVVTVSEAIGFYFQRECRAAHHSFDATEQIQHSKSV